MSLASELSALRKVVEKLSGDVTDKISKLAVGKTTSGLPGPIRRQHPPPRYPRRKPRPIALPQERTTARQTPPGGLLHHDLKPAPSPRVLAVPIPTGQAHLPSGGDDEHPLLDFGDAREGSFFPSLKAASVQSAVPFGPRAGRPLRRLKDPDLARAFRAAGWSSQGISPRLVANSNGFSLHAATRVKAGDRNAREKLCRYVNRPALCLKRLEVRSDGQISWSLRNPWRDGTKAFVMTPYEFLSRRAAIVPHPPRTSVDVSRSVGAGIAPP